MGSASRSQFVARESELATLQRCLEKARDHAPQVAVIEGEAGIGKSTLVRVFIEDSGGDQLVLRASGDERESALAYGVVGQLVERMPATAVRETPGLRAGPMPGSEPLVIGTELAAALGTVARARGAIVVVEDLHWADVASYEALVSFARRLRAVRALIVATYRPAELAHFGGRWERFVNTDERCTRIRLGGLRADAVRTLARHLRHVDVPRPVADRIVEHTGGNPLYTTALVEELPDRALAEAGPSLPAPRSLAGLITTRVAALPPPARSLVVAAGVLGRSCPLTIAARLAGLTDPLEPLEQAYSVRLLEEVAGSSGREVMFPHPLIRAAVYEDIGPASRRDIHRRAAELTSGLTALAHRVAAALGPDDSLACDLAAMAMEQEARVELLVAAELWREAAELSEDAADRNDHLVRAASCLARGGAVAAAALLRDAIERPPPSLLQQLTLGRLSFAEGDAQACEQHVTKAWDLREHDTLPAALDAAALLGEVHVHSGRLDDAERQLRSALRVCPRDAPHHTSLLGKLGIALLARGREEEAQEVSRDRAFRGSAATCAPEYLDGFFMRALTQLWTDQIEDARVELTSILRRAHEYFGLRYEYVDTLCCLGWAEFRCGSWDTAIAHMEESVALAHDSEQRWGYPYVHGLAAIPWALRAKWSEAEAHVAAAIEGARQSFAMGAVFAAAGRATLAWARGDAQQLIDLMNDPAMGPPTTTFGPGIFAFAPMFVDALLDLGHEAEAEERLNVIEHSASAQALPSLGLDCSRLRGKLASARGDVDAAISAFAYGTERALRVTDPMSVALFHYEHGRYLRAHGHARTATAELTKAHGTFARLGAAPFLDAVMRELRSPGMPTTKAPREEPSRLTEKEVRVARLVAAGRTNREIGSELFLTVKAVEYHLARIYAKLGISSRAALAAWMGQHDV